MTNTHTQRERTGKLGKCIVSEVLWVVVLYMSKFSFILRMLTYCFVSWGGGE